MAGAIRSISLNSGGAMPCFGLGTFLATKPGEVGAAVKSAVAAGYAPEPDMLQIRERVAAMLGSCNSNRFV